MFTVPALWFRREMKSSKRSRRPARRPLGQPWIEALESRDLLSTWTTGTPMLTARFGLAAVTANDGRTYAIGGIVGPGTASLKTVEAYSPVSNSWTAVASMPTGRFGLAATLGPDGKIYAIGGFDYKNNVPLNTVEAYTPSSNTWTVVAPMPTARFDLAAATGPDGQIYAIGGFNQGGELGTVEAYNVNSNTWTTVASLNTARFGLAAVTGANGQIYAIGGANGLGVLGTVEAYNVGTGTWTMVASLGTPRVSLAAAEGSDGQIYAMGGFDNNSNVVNTVEAFNPSSGSWFATLPMPTARHDLAAATGTNNRIYAIGGEDANGDILNTVEVLTLTPSGPEVNPSADQFGTEGASSSYTLGSFRDSLANANSWTVDVNWGDNTADTITNTTTQGALSNASHTFGEEGVYTIKVTVKDNTNASGSATFHVTVSDPPLGISASNFSTSTNQAFNNQIVATFTDPGGAEPNSADPSGSISNHYSASIDWGDGTAATNGTITLSNGVFTVRGGHTYTQAGTFATTVTLNHESSQQVAAQGVVTVSVGSTSSVSVTNLVNQNATEGASALFNLGSFTDSNSSANSWSVDVNWGDGTADTVFTASAQGSLGSRSHTFAEEGTSVVTVTVTDNANASGSGTFQVTVADPAVIGSGVNFSAVPGNALSNQNVATFTDPAGAEPNDGTHYTATIDWGDNSGTTTGTISFGGGVFTVSGGHTYAAAGPYQTTVVIMHEGAASTTVHGNVTVGTAAVAVTSPGNQTTTEGASPSFNLGSFSDSNSSAGPWSVSINWGDNTTPTTFTSNNQGQLGTRPHTYAEEGVYPVTVLVTDNANVSGSATYQVTVTDPAVTGSGVSFSATPGSSFTGAVATFTDPGGAEANDGTHYSASINWGDNTAATAGTISLSNGVFTVSGNHNYSQNGTFNTSVIITHEGAPTTTLTGTATVSSTTTGLVNFVNFETGDFSQTAAHVNGAIVTSPALDGMFSLQLSRSNSPAWVEIRQSGTTYYNLPLAYYSFLFQPASQTGEGGVANFQDTSSNYKAAIHLSASGKLLFYDATGKLVATGTTTLNPNQTYTISAKIGTGTNAPYEVRINGNVELSGTANLGAGNNGSIKLGGGSAYTTNYYYDDVAIAANGYPGTTALTVTAPSNQTATAGTASSFNLGSFSDTTSGANSWTVNVNWGDNTTPTTFTTTTPGSLGSQSHNYAQAGNYTATVTVTDNQNVSGSATFQVAVSSSNVGLINFVNFETDDFSQTAAHLNGAIVSSPALDGMFSLQLQRNNSPAWVEIRQGGTTYYNLPTAYYSFLFQFASQTGEGGVINFQDASSNYKAAIHLSASGKLLFYDATGKLVATGTTTLNPNQTYTISAKIGTGTNAPYEVRINGNVELSGTANLGAGNNGSIKLGGGSAYTTNYYYDDVAIAANGYPGTTALTVTAPSNQTATAGTASSFNLGSFSDTTSGANSWTVNVNWGDNTTPTTFTTTTPGSLGSQSHNYAQAGNYTATVTVTDNQNVSGSATFQVAVSSSNVGLINFVNFETDDFSQTAAHLNGAIVSSPALDGMFSLQ